MIFHPGRLPTRRWTLAQHDVRACSLCATGTASVDAGVPEDTAMAKCFVLDKTAGQLRVNLRSKSTGGASGTRPEDQAGRKHYPPPSFSENRIGRISSVLTGRPPRRAGSARHRRTVLTASASSSACPLLRTTSTASTCPEAATVSRKRTVPCQPRRRASSGYRGGRLWIKLGGVVSSVPGVCGR